MHIDGVGELDANLDFQLVDYGDEVLEAYALGEKTCNIQIGEVLLDLKRKIVALDDYDAQQVIPSRIDTACKIKASLRGIHSHG